MNKVLKVLVFIYSIVFIAIGVLAIAFPSQSADMAGFSDVSDLARYYMGAAGTIWIAVGIWGIIGAFNLLKNIIVVKLLITAGLFSAIGQIVFAIQGYADFSDLLVGIIIDGVFAILLLIFYPWKASQSS
jgi:hypothetical protein